MSVLIGLVIWVLVAEAVFAYSMWFGRSGTTKPQRMAWRAGFTGLVALPLWFLGATGLVRQFFFVDAWSLSGVTFISMSLLLVAAMARSVYALILSRLVKPDLGNGRASA